MFKLIAVNAIRGNLSKAVELKRNTTISALFHGIVSSNVAFVTDMSKTDMADFDTVLRQLLPVAWDKEAGKYGYSHKKAEASAELLNMDIHGMRNAYKAADKELRATLVDQFHDHVMEYYNTNAEKKKSEDLDNDKKRDSALSRIKAGVKQAKELGATDEFILDMLASAGVNVSGYVPVLERTKAA